MAHISKPHFGFLLVFALVLTSFGPLSFGLSCAGIFYTPLSEHLGVGTGTLSYYTSILWISSLIFLPFLGKLLSKADARLCVGGSVVIMAADFVWLSFVNSLWQFYLGAFVMGIGITMLLFLAPSTLVNRWFSQRAGFFIGLIMAFTGVGGVVWSAVGGVLIAKIGWSASYLAFAVLTLATLPTSVLLVATDPKSKGLAPWGEAQEANGHSDENSLAKEAPKQQHEDGIDAATAFKTPSFYLIMAMCFLLNFGMYVYFMIPSYVSTLPLYVTMPLLGATASSVAMAGQTISKLVLGYVGDKKPFAGTIAGVSLGFIGVALLAVGGSSALIIYVAAFAYGFFYGVTNVMTPILTKRAFGVRDYSNIYSRISMAASLAGATTGFIWGTVVELFGFGAMFGGVCFFMLLTIAAVVILARNERVTNAK
ncbi:MAG: MFS transporter [Eggerthellaceae bacterium]|nr:MFS transporter [Eggerthellaceae bacterium]